MVNIKGIRKQGDEGYISHENARSFAPVSKSGCISIIYTTNGTRTKLSRELLKAIDNPKRVNILLTEKNIFIFEAQEHEGYDVKGDGIVYDSSLARELARMAGVEVRTSGSDKVGTFVLQALDDSGDRVEAVVSFE